MNHRAALMKKIQKPLCLVSPLQAVIDLTETFHCELPEMGVGEDDNPLQSCNRGDP